MIQSTKNMIKYTAVLGLIASGVGSRSGEAVQGLEAAPRSHTIPALEVTMKIPDIDIQERSVSSALEHVASIAPVPINIESLGRTSKEARLKESAILRAGTYKIIDLLTRLKGFSPGLNWTSDGKSIDVILGSRTSDPFVTELGVGGTLNLSPEDCISAISKRIDVGAVGGGSYDSDRSFKKVSVRLNRKMTCREVLDAVSSAARVRCVIRVVVPAHPRSAFGAGHRRSIFDLSSAFYYNIRDFTPLPNDVP